MGHICVRPYQYRADVTRGASVSFHATAVWPPCGAWNAQMGLGGYVGNSVLILAVIFGLEYIQYVATFISSYAESADMRIRIAERLRKLPLSFFGKRDLADLTTTIMSDCTFVETAFSHFIPELIGAVLSTALIGAGLLAADWRMGLSVLWVAPGIVFSGGRYEAHGRSD